MKHFITLHSNKIEEIFFYKTIIRSVILFKKEKQLDKLWLLVKNVRQLKNNTYGKKEYS